MRGHVRYGNLLHRLPFGRDSFDGVSLFETLEHLPPEVIPRALREVRRMTKKYVIATIRRSVTTPTDRAVGST